MSLRVDAQHDEEQELFELEQERQAWINAIATKYSNLTFIGKTQADRLSDTETEEEEDDNDDEESDAQDDDEEEEYDADGSFEPRASSPIDVFMN